MGEDLSLIKEVGSDSGTRHYDKKVLLDMCYVEFLKLTFSSLVTLSSDISAWAWGEAISVDKGKSTFLSTGCGTLCCIEINVITCELQNNANHKLI